MGDLRKREFVLGGFMLAAGIAYLAATGTLPHKHFIDARFVPYILGAIMCVLGVLQLRAAARTPHGEAAPTGAQAVDYATVWKTVGLIVLYTALLSVVGFPIMTALYLFVQFIVLTPGDRKPSLVVYGIIAVVCAAAIYLLFRHAFDLMLPLGPVDFDFD